MKPMVSFQEDSEPLNPEENNAVYMSIANSCVYPNQVWYLGELAQDVSFAEMFIYSISSCDVSRLCHR